MTNRPRTQSATEIRDDKDADGDHDTRHRILTLILRHSPITATEISSELGLSAAGVRRHLDNIVSDKLAETMLAPRRGQRGRPAKIYRLTDQGRAQFGHDYDTLALLALRALRKAGGEEAVEDFAADRMHHILDSADVKADVKTKAKAIAAALTEKGYAATVDYAGGGVQICRHHCPIQDVAQEFPELCAAEHQVVAELLGQHTQPLATIADGNGICTTHIPLTTISPSPKKDN